MCQAVAKMFASSPSKTRFHNVRAIGLYGVGGIGKTTLCKSLCNEYRGKFNGKVWHAELGKNNAEEIQKDVLCHLVGTSETLLKKTLNCEDQVKQLTSQHDTC
jgi:GTPase SAR1 family protein